MTTELQDRLAEGRAALTRGDWERAQTTFATVLASGESPEALEGIARARAWLGDVEGALGSWERAYQLFREKGNHLGAVRVACELARQALLVQGERAVYNGWIERARRLLVGVEPAPEHILLSLLEANFESDPEAKRAKATEAGELARRFDLVDLEMLARALVGISLVSEGEVAEGMRLLDEATAAATSGEMEDVQLIAQTCCTLIFACERVMDFDRAGQWCVRVKEFCRRTGLRPIFAVCRTHYATVLTERGDWAEAEQELLGAAEQLPQHSGGAVEAVARLGELRRRQGRYDEAAALFDRVAHHPSAQLGQAALALTQGDAGSAARWAERFLRQVPEADRTERARGLELLGRARAALGDTAGGREALEGLEAVTLGVASPLLSAGTAMVRGIVASAAGDLEQARTSLEDALDCYARANLLFEVAEARVHLGDVLRRSGEQRAADREDQEARAIHDRLGVVPAARPEASGRVGTLSARELEVLRMVAEGLTDREIADRLVLSPHTVHRHVSNLLTKLGVSSRAAAAAGAARQGLL